jgi:hypothetical protein
MRKGNFGWTLALAIGLAMPSLGAATAAKGDKTEKTAKSESAAATAGMSKEEADKMKEHMKLRNEIKRVKYPAAKADIVAKVKGIKTDDKKWFTETLPDRTYSSADEVYSALGWEATPPAAGTTGGTGTTGMPAAPAAPAAPSTK